MMLTAADLVKMQADVLEVISDHSVSIIIRRGDSALAAQSVRVERTGGGASAQKSAANSDQTESRISIVGGIGLNIAIEDRFTIGGFLYEVTAVSPNSQIGVQAEAVLIQ